MTPQGKICSVGKDNGSYRCIGRRDYSFKGELRGLLRKEISLSGP